MADAGAGAPNSPFFEALDQNGLIDAFADILDIVRDCIFTLDVEIAPGFESQGTVVVNGVEIPYNDPDGWEVLDPRRIELLGESCASIQSGTVNIEISFSCDGVIPPG